MKFLVDQCVDDVVAAYLTGAGFECHKVRDISAPDAPDPLVAYIAELEGLIIVTHDRHFRKIGNLVAHQGFRRSIGGAGVILLQVPEHLALDRLRESMTVIEALYVDSVRRGFRLQVRINPSNITLTDNDLTG